MSEEWTTGTVTLSLFGEPLAMEMSVPANPVRARRMLPILQQMANSFTDIGVAAAESQGKTVSCQKGCGACCRQVIPIAETEVHHIRDLIGEMPEPRRSEVMQKFLDACRQLQEIKWFDRLSKYADFTKEERETLVAEYFHLQIACPFLEDEACSIHPQRPLVCREYLVSSPAEFCQNPTVETVHRVKLPLLISEAANRFALPQAKSLDFIPLILALHWAEKFPENRQEKNGNEWMQEFFEVLMSNENERKRNRDESSSTSDS